MEKEQTQSEVELLETIERLKEENENLKKRLDASICPCKVGDTVYAVRTTNYGWNEKKYWIEKATVKKIGWDKKGFYIIVGNTRSNLSSFYKTIFLTEAEAMECWKRKQK